MLGWIGNHPNYTLETKSECPNCGEKQTEKNHCLKCGAWWQGKMYEDK